MLTEKSSSSYTDALETARFVASQPLSSACRYSFSGSEVTSSGQWQ